MFLNYRRWILAVSALALFAAPANSETVLENIARTGLLKIGIREDAVPFGYRDYNDDLSGLCLDFAEVLLSHVKQTLGREAILVKLYRSTLGNRFSAIEDRVVHIECGPNTIRSKLEARVAFSRPFFVTGTQLLVNADSVNQITKNPNFKGLPIGVLRNTTNQAFIQKFYPQATIREFQGLTGRTRGIQALRQGKIAAFASDGILLLGEATLQGLAIGRTYKLIPQTPLNCEFYGMLLPENDPQWLELVNASIVDAREHHIFRSWFGAILPEIQETSAYCQKDKTLFNDLDGDRLDGNE